jgi:hypothetical protein
VARGSAILFHLRAQEEISDSGPGIQDFHACIAEIGNIAGNHNLSMHAGCGGYQCICHRPWSRRAEVAPLQRNGRIDGEYAIGIQVLEPG